MDITQVIEQDRAEAIAEAIIEEMQKRKEDIIEYQSETIVMINIIESCIAIEDIEQAQQVTGIYNLDDYDFLACLIGEELTIYLRDEYNYILADQR